ncbi:MAG: S-methyl-5-thioribose-1-phosphate isomerase [Methylophilaceae bacterium]|nr:S-methyl-5-thioribose-1-phosphate isomerase [Methylophilaceae bacterium]
MQVQNQNYRTIWPNTRLKSVHIIDQTLLPHQFCIAEIHTLQEMIRAIKTMQVRGAPLIGAAAAYGLALASSVDISENDAQSNVYLQQAGNDLINSRPTAVNLQWAVNRMLSTLLDLPLIKRNMAAWKEAAAICEEDVKQNQAIGQHGLALIKILAGKYLVSTCNSLNSKPLNILTHCNAGWLATVDFGTALAPIYAAHDAGISVHVWVDETRPRNQGVALTAWELAQHGVPHTVISDNAGGHLMQHGSVDMVLVGADRVTSTGDVCNKIGTYLKALAAFDNNIPFYAAVPSPTIDWTIQDGLKEIEIEERSAHEVTYMTGKLASGEIAEINILPPDNLTVKTQVANPAFDVTPARLVTGIIIQHGIYAPSELINLKFSS